jgi:L-amino acid N-acyltransferase YncA
MPIESAPTITIRNAVASDAAALAAIYNHYVTETHVTFEVDAVSVPEMADRLRDTGAEALPWLIAESEGRVVGYACASKWKGRCAYRFSAEIAVYVHCDRGGRGIGSALYERLLPTLAERGIHTVLGGIALPNEASIALHEKFGMEKVAQLREVGFKLGRWIDVGYWQRIL